MLELLQIFSFLIISSVTLSSFFVYQEVVLSTVLQKRFSQSSLLNLSVEVHSSRHSLSASIGPVVQLVCTFSIPLRISHVPLLGLSVTNPAELLEMIKAERVTMETQMWVIVVVGLRFKVVLIRVWGKDSFKQSINPCWSILMLKQSLQNTSWQMWAVKLWHNVDFTMFETKLLSLKFPKHPSQQWISWSYLM